MPRERIAHCASAGNRGKQWSGAIEACVARALRALSFAMFRRNQGPSREIRCKKHGLVVWRERSCLLCRASRREAEKRRRVITMLTAFTLAAATSALWLRQPRSVARAAALTASLVDASTDWPPAAALRQTLIGSSSGPAQPQPAALHAPQH